MAMLLSVFRKFVDAVEERFYMYEKGIKHIQNTVNNRYYEGFLIPRYINFLNIRNFVTEALDGNESTRRRAICLSLRLRNKKETWLNC